MLFSFKKNEWLGNERNDLFARFLQCLLQLLLYL